MKQLILTFVCCALAAPRLGAWSDEGHQAIAQAAYARLNTYARQKVDAILAGEALTNAAVWSDNIRGGVHPGPLASTAEGKAFNQKFPDNSLWHYVDLPLNTQKYGKNTEFTSTQDVVHALETCLGILEGNSAAMTERQALYWLIHLVGDIHQPVHVGCGYYLFDDEGNPHLLTNPQDILNRGARANDDRGANRLRYKPSQKLHAYWDRVLVDHVAKPDQNLKDVLTSHIAQASYEKTRGNYHRWPAKWATATVLAARQAYAGIDFKDRAVDNGDWFIRVDLPADYERNNTALAEEQLARAAFNLAELLNRVHWNHTGPQYQPPFYLP